MQPRFSQQSESSGSIDGLNEYEPALVEWPLIVQGKRHAKKANSLVAENWSRWHWSHKSAPPDLDSGTTRTAQGISYSKR
jgi:hypothetical protein